MDQKIVVHILNANEYLENSIEIGLDDDWVSKRENFDQRVKAQGVYILHVSPARIIYVGKTRGPTMDFATRLYRHAARRALQDSRVYKTLVKVKQEKGGPILVSLITIERIRSLFEGVKISDAAMIDIYEQVLIHLLKPEV